MLIKIVQNAEVEIKFPLYLTVPGAPQYYAFANEKTGLAVSVYAISKMTQINQMAMVADRIQELYPNCIQITAEEFHKALAAAQEALASSLPIEYKNANHE